MADVPFYLQGSQTGGLLQGLQQPAQSYIPAISGTQPQQYTPGYGTAPYGGAPQQNDQALITSMYQSGMSYGDVQDAMAQYHRSGALPTSPQQAATQGAVGGANEFIQNKINSATNPAEAEWWRNKAKSVASGNDQFIPGYSGGVSSYTSPQQAATQGAVAGATPNNGLTAVGQSNAWLSPAELAAKNGQMTPISRGGSGGGGGGADSIQTAAGGLTGGGSGYQNMPAPQNQNMQMPSLGQGLLSGGSQLSYTPPQNQMAPQQAGALNMQQANPQDAMNQYLATPGNQLLGDPSYQRFQHSPGYQYAVDEAMKQVQGNASSRGLLESGRVVRDMTDRAQGMAQQDYGNWWNRQSQLFGDYQNRLQGLAGGGTGSDLAYGLGQNLGTGSLATGGNLASLFGNQGSSGYGGIANTGAAQANSIQQAGSNQAQINAANNSTLLAGAVANQRF